MDAAAKVANGELTDLFDADSAPGSGDEITGVVNRPSETRELTTGLETEAEGSEHSAASA
jgi:hypothetical protein